MKKDIQYFNNLPYKVVIEFNEGDDTWTAYHPELGWGTCYAIGDTQDEAIKLLADERKDLLEILLEDGVEIPEPKLEEELPSGKFMVRIPRSLHQHIRENAEKESVSLNQYVTTVLAEKAG